MTIDITFTHIITLALSLITGFAFLIRHMVSQYDKTLSKKFGELDDIRKSDGGKWDTRYGKTEAVVSDLANRIVRLETEMKHVPTQASFNGLTEAVADVRGQCLTQTELLQRMERQLGLINEWMLENK